MIIQKKKNIYGHWYVEEFLRKTSEGILHTGPKQCHENRVYKSKTDKTYEIKKCRVRI